MWRPTGLVMWLVAGGLWAATPTDLDSPFFKKVIYQKTIGGVGVGPLEEKLVLGGEIKGDIYEFQKVDGTTFLVSKNEVRGVIPIFPTWETPCEAADVQSAIAVLEQGSVLFPQQEAVSEAVIERWRKLLEGLQKAAPNQVIPSDQLESSAKSFFLFWVLGLPAMVLGCLVFSLFRLTRARMFSALTFFLLAVAGGATYVVSLAAAAEPQPIPTPREPNLAPNILWVVVAAQGTVGMTGEKEIRIPVAGGLNALSKRLKYEARGTGLLQPTLKRMSFSWTEGCLVVRQPIQVGPILVPLSIGFEVLPERENFDQLVMRTVRLGRLSLPTEFSRGWIGQVFEPYRVFWSGFGVSGLMGWRLDPHGQLIIQIKPSSA